MPAGLSPPAFSYAILVKKGGACYNTILNKLNEG